MDLVNHILVVAMASRLFHIYDIRKMDSPAQTRESSLKFMTRALACMSDGQGTFPLNGFRFRNPPRACASATSLLFYIFLIYNWAFGRIRDGLRGGTYRRRILRSKPTGAGEEVRIQVPPADDRRCRPCVARQRARVPPRVSAPFSSLSPSSPTPLLLPRSAYVNDASR